MINDLLIGIGVYILAIIFHEIGHFIFYVERKRPVKFTIEWDTKKLWVYTGNAKIYPKMSLGNRIAANLSGVVFGFIPLIVAAQLVPIYMILFIPYIMGCKGDIEKAGYLWKQLKQQSTLD